MFGQNGGVSWSRETPFGNALQRESLYYFTFPAAQEQGEEIASLSINLLRKFSDLLRISRLDNCVSCLIMKEKIDRGGTKVETK